MALFVCTTGEYTDLLTLLYDNLLFIVFYLYSHPLHLAYILYFSSYILQLVSFLFPLLLSTSIILFLFSRQFTPESSDGTVCLLDQLCSLVVFTIGNVFDWEFEAVGELYNNVGQVCDAEEEQDPSVICIETCEAGEVRMEMNSRKIGIFSQSDAYIGERVSVDNSRSFKPQTPSKGEEPCKFSSLNSSDNSIMSHFDVGDLMTPKEGNFVPQTPDRVSEIHLSSALAKRAKRRGAASEGATLSGGESMRITGEELYKHSGLNFEVVDWPDEIFYDCSELSRSQSEKTGANSRTMLHETLDSCSLGREGSMRKEKEWRRTLACKLYEERMTFRLREEKSRAIQGVTEEMDLLWEAYENDAGRFKDKEKKAQFVKEEVDEEDDEPVGQVCCLKALRLSTGKMNLSVGRSNLAKISKVLKGIGSFRRSGSRRSRQASYKVES